MNSRKPTRLSAQAATRTHHPAEHHPTPTPRSRTLIPQIPGDQEEVVLKLGERQVKLTNLKKIFWPELKLTKRDLLQYYAQLSPVLLPHLRDRAMVMKRYPNGIAGKFFFMKRAPEPRPEWIELCEIRHRSGNQIRFPIVQDLASLLWVVNLGCIDLNPWYARCDDVDRPDYLHFDLDPLPGTGFKQVCQVGTLVHNALVELQMPNLVKTTGSRGLHIYIPLVRGPTQKQVWGLAKQFAQGLASLYPNLITAEYRIAKRPPGRVLIDYNQNAWGRTLASVYSVRPQPQASVSMPVTWDEVAAGFRIEEFHLKNAPQRVRRLGDLWKPLLAARGRYRLERLLP